MSREREQAGGLAALVIAGVVLAMLVLCGGGGVYYVRHIRMLRIMEEAKARQALMDMELARAAMEQAKAQAATASQAGESSAPQAP